MSQLARFDFRMEPEQQIDVVIKIPEETRGVIHGVVVDENQHVVQDAVVKLFEVGDHSTNDSLCVLRPITHTFTDECGQFLFGPLCPDRFYAIKIWVNDVHLCRQTVDIHEDHGCLEQKECDQREISAALEAAELNPRGEGDVRIRRELERLDDEEKGGKWGR